MERRLSLPRLCRNTLKAWVSLLEETRNQAKIRATFADKLRDQFTTPLKPYIAEKTRLFTKYAEFTQRVQTDLQVSFGELARVRVAPSRGRGSAPWTGGSGLRARTHQGRRCAGSRTTVRVAPILSSSSCMISVPRSTNACRPSMTRP